MNRNAHRSIRSKQPWSRLGITALAAALLLPVGVVEASAASTGAEQAPSLVAQSAAAPVASAAAAVTSISDLTAATRVDAHTVTLTAGAGKIRVTGTAAATVHVEFAKDGVFSDPDTPPTDTTQPDEPMIKNPPSPTDLALTETATAYRLSTSGAVLTITKTAPKMTLSRTDGTVVLAESAPLSWDATGTTQTIAPKPGEQFYGGGEQNGGYNHTGKTIQVANSFNWNEGGFNNSQPYYVSTAGYGVFRHTFQPGSYTFGSTVTTTENEQRFDAYYFVGDLKSVIGSYTDLVGKPFMPPIYGLELGDSDCYLHNANRGERHTLDSLNIAQGYVDNGMPNGWMLVNDGYGCGYENLAETGTGLNQRNMELGLWTQNGLANQDTEVAAGVRVRKLDVAWVGPGYRFALDGCQTAYDGINANTSVDARGFVYQPNSWAGAQRCGVLWSGDQSGSWDYIRWQIPTYAASTLSGIAYNTGDIDGIFGGSPKTYVRDLQWKMFLPTTMTMDGWSGYEKQPWRYGDELNAINRKYLLLKERLLPYQYTYSAHATTSGVGQVRPLYLEYPNDPVAASDAAKYEFLSGEDFLVAPVYSDTSVRNGIYLPAGTWVDYWTGRTYTGPTTINGYSAPLDTLPLFVKGGAVVPMWPEGTTSWKTRDKSHLDVDVFPQGNSEFDLYEDDGSTKQFAAGKSSTQKIAVTAPQAGVGTITVSIGKVDGTYAGQADTRTYGLTVHSPAKPTSVKAGATLDEVAGAEAFAQATTGWYYDGATGVVHVKTASVSRTSTLDVVITGGSALLHQPNGANGSVSFTAPAMISPGSSVSVPVTFRNDTTADVTSLKVALTSKTAGISATPTEVTVAQPVKPGKSVTVPVTVVVGAGVKSGVAVLDATAAYVSSGHPYSTAFSAEVTVPYPTVKSAFNNNGVTDINGYAAGDLDGSKDSLSTEQVAAAGVTRGSTVTVDGINYTWPDVAPADDDNVAAAGQTIAVSGRGNVLGLLGTGTGTSAGGDIVVNYTDGTSTTAATGFPNWCCLATDTYGAKIAVPTKGRYTPTGLGNTTTDYRAYATTVRISASKTVASVVLPSNSTMHVFDIVVGSSALPEPPPPGESWLSDRTPISSTNGYGPVEKDMSNGESAAGDGKPLTLAGKVYPKGLGTHAPSMVSYNLAGACTKFTVTVGIDDEIADYGSVIFKIRVDGIDKVISPTLTGASAPVDLTADVTGADYLDLVVTPGATSISGDHGDWAAPQITCSDPTTPQRFSDVPADSQFYDDIEWLASAGITSGFPDGTFHPAGPVERQALAAFLYRLANGTDPAPACTTRPYPDVPVDSTFCGAIAWLKSKNIAAGWADGTFRPAAAIERQAMASFLYRWTHPGATAPACTTKPFSDVGIGNSFCGSISWLKTAGVTNGYPDGSFHPGASIERQAMAAFLHRLDDQDN